MAKNGGTSCPVCRLHAGVGGYDHCLLFLGHRPPRLAVLTAMMNMLVMVGVAGAIVYQLYAHAYDTPILRMIPERFHATLVRWNWYEPAQREVVDQAAVGAYHAPVVDNSGAGASSSRVVVPVAPGTAVASAASGDALVVLEDVPLLPANV